MSVVNKAAGYMLRPHRIISYVKNKCTHYYVVLNNMIKSQRSGRVFQSSDLPALDEIKQRSLVRSDISDHLETIFTESLAVNPKLIVELGVRGGESTYVFQRVAKICGSKLVSVDIEDCEEVITGDVSEFVKADDIEFAGRFAEWCGARGHAPVIDVLFVDTSHLYEHTLDELNHWLPFLAPRSKAIFHDSNLRPVYARRDGTLGETWDNNRAVIRALETFFETGFDESRDFVDYRKGWLIRHQATCNGLTILERHPSWGVAQ